MKQKRQLIDNWVASRGPFLRFLFHFRDKSFFMTTGATLVRYEQPSEGSASPPWLSRYKRILNSMPKAAFEFTLHRLVVNRNLYTEHCYRYFLEYPNFNFFMQQWISLTIKIPLFLFSHISHLSTNNFGLTLAMSIRKTRRPLTYLWP